MRPLINVLVITALALGVFMALSLMTPNSARPDDGSCQLRCSLVYTKEVRACEHEPDCLHQAHQKYDACAQKCDKK